MQDRVSCYRVKTTLKWTGTFVVVLALWRQCYGIAASRFQVPQVAPKEERRVLWYASDGLRGEMGCLGPAQRQALKVVTRVF